MLLHSKLRRHRGAATVLGVAVDVPERHVGGEEEGVEGTYQDDIQRRQLSQVTDARAHQPATHPGPRNQKTALPILGSRRKSQPGWNREGRNHSGMQRPQKRLAVIE